MSFLLSLFILSASASAEIAIIVNAQNPVNGLTRSQVSDIFTKRTKNWPDGMPSKFFDRTDSEIRNDFLRTIIKKTPREMEIYWIGQKLYSGQSAPSQVSTNQMVEIMVSRFPGGIGYVSKDYEPTRAVKKIVVTE